MWLLILQCYTILCFYFTFFLLLRSPRDKFHNLKRLIRFNYKPLSIIITIFQIESFLLLNWKVSQLKCISLIKLTSTLNTLFLLEWNFFYWEKGWNEWQRQCTKSTQKVHRGVVRRGVVVITAAQIHSNKPELRFCADSNPARDVSEIRDGEDLWQ